MTARLEVRVGGLASEGVEAVLVPVAADGSALTRAGRRLEALAGGEPRAQLGRLGELPVGAAAVTGAGELPVRLLVHAAVASALEPPTVAGVRRALVNGLRRLAEWGVERAALVPFGSGAGGLDLEEAAALHASVWAEHVRAHAWPALLRVVVETEYEREVFERAVRRVWGGVVAGPSSPETGAPGPGAAGGAWPGGAGPG